MGGLPLRQFLDPMVSLVSAVSTTRLTYRRDWLTTFRIIREHSELSSAFVSE
jgi:hypothetical protein